MEIVDLRVLTHSNTNSAAVEESEEKREQHGDAAATGFRETRSSIALETFSVFCSALAALHFLFTA